MFRRATRMFRNLELPAETIGLVRNAEVRWKGRACTCNAARCMCRIVPPDFRRRRRKWLLAFGFERVV